MLYKFGMLESFFLKSSKIHWYGYLWCLNILKQEAPIFLEKSIKEEFCSMFMRKGTVLTNIPLVCLFALFNLFKIGVPITKSARFETLPM